MLLSAAGPVRAQIADSTRTDSLRVPVPALLQGDSLALPPAFTDTTARSVPPPTGDGLTSPVTFSARDSVVILPRKGANVGKLFGEAKVAYDEVELTAPEIEVRFDEDELRARGVRNDTGWVALPAFTQAEETFTAEDFRFNLRTNKGRFTGIRTSIEDGYLLGDISKVSAQDSVLFVSGGGYTTCSLREPHYHLRSEKIIVLNENWIVTGPIHLRLFNIPFPVWLPFGVLPATEGRRSGPLAPDYGEDNRLGFYLRGLGWYWPINDYSDLELRGGLWTSGSWQINPTFRYNVRYKYSGSLSADWVRSRVGEGDDPTFQVNNLRSLAWSHRQDINPTSSFNASVNLSSNSYLQTVSQNYNDNVTNTTQSSISYRKSWPASKRSFSADIRQRQTFSTGEASLTLPSLSFRQNSFSPFQRNRRPPGESERWYEKITTSYSGALDNRYDYRPLADSTDVGWLAALFSPSKYREATGDDEHLDIEASHRIPVNASYAINSLFGRPFNLNVNPSIQYTEDWFIRSERRFIDPTDSTLVTESVSDFVALRQWNVGVSANTTFYGTFPWRVGRLNGFRHVVNPSLSFNYRPDFSRGFGYYDSYVDPRVDDAEDAVVRYPIVRGVNNGRQMTVGLNVSNRFITRLAPEDTSASARSELLTLLNLSFSTAYNFAADSLNLADLRFNGSTSLLDNKLRLSFSGSFSPYELVRDTDDPQFGRARNRYLLTGGRFPLRLQRISFTAGTDFRSSNTGRRPGTSGPPSTFGNLEANQPTGTANDPFNNSFQNTPTGYADFSVPWSIGLDVAYSLTRDATGARRDAFLAYPEDVPFLPDDIVFPELDQDAIPTLQHRYTLTLNTDFDFSLTPKWKIRGRSGYDFKNNEVVTTNISVLRDLHCWQMSFNWVPFGSYQRFAFTLQVKSGHLSDILKLSQPRNDGIGDRLGGQLGL